MKNSNQTLYVKRKLGYVFLLRSDPINLEDMTDAEHLVIRICHRTHFKEERRKWKINFTCYSLITLSVN